jgi:hypothetical protein
MQSSYEAGLPSSAMELVMGWMSVTSRRLLRSPVTQTLEPPSIMRGDDWVPSRSRMEERRSDWTPQTLGEQTICVTLSIVEGMSGSVARREAAVSSDRRSIATEVGDRGRWIASRRQPGGQGILANSEQESFGEHSGGGSGGGGRGRGSAQVMTM